MNESATITAATETDLPALADLAGVIWRKCYPGIISDAQISYMLAGMYAPDILCSELRLGIRFYRLFVSSQFAGFASIGPANEAATIKLHKLYLLSDYHGQGLGSLLLKHCEAEACKLGGNRLILSVNKHNARAITAYQRNGFKVVQSVVVDIGGGFVMDDFIMTKELSRVP